MTNQMIQAYIKHPKKQQDLYKRTLWIVVVSQMFGGAGLAAGITVGALLAEEMLGTNALAGLPAALFTLGSAGAALLVGRLSNRYGRRNGLATGFMIGGIGAIGVVFAAVYHSIGLLFLALLVYGAGTATNLQARYAGTDLANSKQRGTAISIAMVATTFGAVAGPNLVEVMGGVATIIGVPALAGPFILSAIAFLVAGLVLFIFLRPDPFLIAAALHEKQQQTGDDITVLRANKMHKKGIIVGAAIMVLSQIIMVAIMTMTPIHMGHHGHSLRAIGLVIGFHVAAMYFPSLITGMLVDKVGRLNMAIASGVTLLLAGVMAAIAPGDSVFYMTVALVLLGLGWNFGLISGTALIVDATEPATRAKTQGTVDVFVALAGAAGGGMSGMVVAGFSYEILSLVGGVLSLLLLPIVIWSLKE
ncbi:putative MFS-type transporter YdeG [Lysinibacillus alkalisoli]|uniref:MFS-type transporter YdeG n=1 Tax=Lysinibacillus alkalisoli TaxID=1911548 RepID=A0A917G2L3_9BACI|nr:MFS transporter [Lysinibacillus alkalisoli]GGG18701.1 putative MFS-type transporter YdeG [Lysinibacillus alkalisoli]